MTIALPLSRRRLLELAAAGVPVLAGLGRHQPSAWAQGTSPIVKPLPPEWFVPFSTNAEMRWDSVAGLPYTTPNERFLVRNHTATPIIDPDRLTGPAYPADQPPLTRQAVKSAFELPAGAELRAGRQHLLTGRSWSGSAPIRRVEISTDGGRRWERAQLHGPNLPNAWVRWRFPFRPRVAGAHELQARATDERQQTQPASVPFNDAGYLFWAVVKHPVQVRA